MNSLALTHEVDLVKLKLISFLTQLQSRIGGIVKTQ